MRTFTLVCIAVTFLSFDLSGQDLKNLQLVSNFVNFFRIVSRNDISVKFSNETNDATILKGNTVLRTISSAIAAEFYGDSLLIVTKFGNKDNVLVYDISNGTFASTTIPAQLMSLSYNKDISIILASDRQFGNVLVFDFSKNSVTLLDKYARFCFFVGSFSDAGMVSVGTSDWNNPEAHEIRFYSKDGRLVAKSHIKLRRYNPDLTSFVVSVNATELFTNNTSTDEVFSYRLEGSQISRKKIQGISLLLGQGLLDGELVYVGTYNEFVVVYDSEFTPLRTFQFDPISKGYGISDFSIEGSTLVISYYKLPK